MRTLVVLAVLGVCYASAGQVHNQNYVGYAGPYQTGYRGPLASTVPAGVDGTITPVSDTYEVAAAKNDFFRAYNAQLARVGAYSYGTPYNHGPAVHYGAPYNHGHAVSVASPLVRYAGHGYGVPSAYGAVPAPVHDTPAVAAAKAEFFRLYNQQAAAAAAAPDDYVHDY